MINLRRRSKISRDLLFVLFLTGCAENQESLHNPMTDGEVTRVHEVIQQIIAADNAGDVEAIVQLYSIDAILIPPTGANVTGRPAIEERYREGFKQFELEVNFTSDETFISGDLAYDRGITTGRRIWLDGREPTLLNDKYLMIFHRQPDGVWKIARLMWNQNE